MASKQALEDLMYLPASEGNLPHITPAMVIDCLADYEILSAPRTTKRVFRWFISISRESTACTIPANMPDASLLFICDSINAATFLEERPAAFALVLLRETDNLDAFASYADRTIVIRKIDRLSYLALLLQSYFIKILLWENDLKNIGLRNGTLDDMLDASCTVLGNFIFVSDNDFNVIARTSAIEPPDDLHKRIIANGCLTPQTIAEKRFRLPEKTFYTRKASDICPFDRVSFPVHFSHSYYGSISMVCSASPDTEGLRDLYSTLVKHMAPLCMKLWSQHAKLHLPSYFFLKKLLEHEPMGQEYFLSQMDMAGLSKAKQFKLVILDIDEGVDPSRVALVSRAVETINQGDVFCFPYQDRLLVLLHSQIENGISHRSTLEELENKVHVPYGVAGGASSVFFGITDLDLAYRQAKIALGFKNAVEREQFALDEGSAQGVYLFENAMLYYLIDPHGKDERFLNFMFEGSIASILYREDIENGTNLFALMWFYLKFERNATAVAKRLHMHRNTVLYHVEKIEKRFDFSLSEKTARDWMLLCYKYMFLVLSASSLAEIFPENPGSE